MQLLITGGAGYIGSHSCIELAAAGYELLIVDNFSNSHPEVIHRMTEIIGKPTSCDDVVGVKSCRWSEGKISVSVNFVGDQVILHTAENIR